VTAAGRVLLTLSALYLTVIGALSLLVPASASSGLGHDMTLFDLFATRTVGAILLTVAITNWWASLPRAGGRTGVLVATLFLNSALAVVDVASIRSGTIPADSWTGVAVHGVFIAAFLVVLVGSRTAVTRPA
jgi:hypothetical protein